MEARDINLIDADALLKKAQALLIFGGAEVVWAHDVMVAPTIDPIRAAGGCRCGECKYWDDDGRCEPPENGLIQEYTKPTDFCSYGEPRVAQDNG